MAADFQGQWGRRCKVEYKCVALASEFGMKMLAAKFPQDAEAILAKLGVFSRGKNKGQPRGWIHWTKIIEGGYDAKAGRVLRGGTVDWMVMDGYDRDKAEEIGTEIRWKRIDAERDERLAQAKANKAAVVAANEDAAEEIKFLCHLRNRAAMKVRAGEMDKERWLAQHKHYRDRIKAQVWAAISKAANAA